MLESSEWLYFFLSSKLNTYQESKQLLEQPGFELQHVYTALEVIAKETDFIQSELYENSLARSRQLERAAKLIETRPGDIQKRKNVTQILTN